MYIVSGTFDGSLRNSTCVLSKWLSVIIHTARKQKERKSLWRWRCDEKKPVKPRMIGSSRDFYVHIVFCIYLEFDEQQEAHFCSICFWVFFFLQLDADRDEEEVFCDISMTLDNKLFPSSEPAAGETQIAENNCPSRLRVKSIDRTNPNLKKGCLRANWAAAKVS